MANNIIAAVKYVLILKNGTFIPFYVTARLLKPSHTPQSGMSWKDISFRLRSKKGFVILDWGGDQGFPQSATAVRWQQ